MAGASSGHRTAIVGVLVLAAVLLGARTGHAQFIRGPGEFLFANVSSDYVYRFRVAVTPKSNIVYGIFATESRLAQYSFNRSDRGIRPASWTTEPIEGLAEKQPALNVDSQSDRVYFIHPQDGKIYSYDATLPEPKNAEPVWVTPFVCTDLSDGRDQHLQAFSATDKRLLARCNDSIVLLNSKGGLLRTFNTTRVQAFVQGSDLAAPLPTFANFTRMVTWYTTYDSDDVPSTSLQIWSLTGNAPNTVATKPQATIALPKGVLPSGVNTNSSWAIIVVSSEAPLIHVFGQVNNKLSSTFDFKPLVDPEDALQIRVVPSPIMVNRTMYGIIQGIEVSPYPWIYPDSYYFWVFALNYTSSKAPRLLWITERTNTSGELVPQVPWVTNTAVFIADTKQNATRSYRLDNGGKWFHAPAEPLSRARSAYTLISGTYKISLPWVSSDGLDLVFQYDNGAWDESPNEYDPLGNIRCMVGIPVMPSPPPAPMEPSPPEDP